MKSKSHTPNRYLTEELNHVLTCYKAHNIKQFSIGHISVYTIFSMKCFILPLCEFYFFLVWEPVHRWESCVDNQDMIYINVLPLVVMCLILEKGILEEHGNLPTQQCHCDRRRKLYGTRCPYIKSSVTSFQNLNIKKQYHPNLTLRKTET